MPDTTTKPAGFEQSFKNIDNTLRKDAGVSSELDYVEQTSWILFLKYLNDLEEDKKTEAALAGKPYTYILDEKYRWPSWAHPKTPDGKLDHNTALAGDDLRDFVNNELFPYLGKFKHSADHPETIEYKVGEIFSELRNKIQSGYVLREVLDAVDGMRFRSQKEKHELSHLYETKIKNMGNAGRNGGEYYTPRPLIQAIVKVVNPQIGQTVYDGACGSAGFLVEAYEHMRESHDLTTQEFEFLQKKTLYGKELKSLAYVIGTMNMILHGIEAPNLRHMNTLSEPIADIEEKDRYDVVLANPPFGGKIRSEIQQNFPIKTGETAFLFLQHFIKILRAGGRGGIVIKNTFLSNTDNASVSLRKLLLESANLHTILDMPSGTFQGAGVKTVVLFFDKGAPTTNIWYYQLTPGRNLGKTNPLNEQDMAEFVELQKTKADSAKSWSINVTDINQTPSTSPPKTPTLPNPLPTASPQKSSTKSPSSTPKAPRFSSQSASCCERLGDVHAGRGLRFTKPRHLT
jgi:type I restriction enzyme M protein